MGDRSDHVFGYFVDGVVAPFYFTDPVTAAMFIAVKPAVRPASPSTKPNVATERP